MSRRPTPAVDRAVAVLDLLARSPGDRHTLSDIARELQMNKATCHSLLGALEANALLIRSTRTKGYRLGPRLVSLASAAISEADAALDLLREPVRRLVNHHGLGGFVACLVGDEIVILSADVPDNQVYRPPSGRTPKVGRRARWRAPIAPMFAVWGTGARRAAWLAGSSPELESVTPPARTLQQIRERGFDVAYDAGPHARALDLLSRSEAGATFNLREIVLALLDDPDNTAEGHSVRHIGAPVFGADGHALVTVSLDGFRPDVSVDEVERIAHELVGLTEEVTSALHHPFPDDWRTPSPQPVGLYSKHPVAIPSSRFAGSSGGEGGADAEDRSSGRRPDDHRSSLGPAPGLRRSSSGDARGCPPQHPAGADA